MGIVELLIVGILSVALLVFLGILFVCGVLNFISVIRTILIFFDGLSMMFGRILGRVLGFGLLVLGLVVAVLGGFGGGVTDAISLSGAMLVVGGIMFLVGLAGAIRGGKKIDSLTAALSATFGPTSSPVEHHIEDRANTRLCDGRPASDADISSSDWSALRDARKDTTLCPDCQDRMHPARYRAGTIRHG